MAQWEFVEWLLYWILETSHFEFEWDRGNSIKIEAKHGVTIPEVEAVFRSGLALPLATAGIGCFLILLKRGSLFLTYGIRALRRVLKTLNRSTWRYFRYLMRR
jgi:hypothetical protein